MITNNHLENISLELSKLQELLIALDLVSDSLERGETEHAQKGHDATIGIVRALGCQHNQLRGVVDGALADAIRAERLAREAAA